MIERDIVLEFDSNKLKLRLGALSDFGRVAFMLLLCERMMPQLHGFAKSTGFDLSLYSKCLEQGWAYLGEKASSIGYERLAQACFDSAPDTEQFSHVLTSAALDTALSIGYLMTFLSDHNIDHAVDVAGLARDTVAMYVDRMEEAASPFSLSLEVVNRNPLVQRELQRQEDDLVFLERLPSDTSQKAISRLKELARRPPRMLQTGTEV